MEYNDLRGIKFIVNKYLDMCVFWLNLKLLNPTNRGTYKHFAVVFTV